jgi:hypothetical protein
MVSSAAGAGAEVPEGSHLGEALTASTPTGAQWAGAARYFAGWEFRRAKKGEDHLLPQGLKQRLLEAARGTRLADNIERAERAYGY